MTGKQAATHPLSPRSVEMEVENLAREDGISPNQFVATTIAELSACSRPPEPMTRILIQCFQREWRPTKCAAL
jgi:hypothetical protein